jgi:hypothetical protein
VGEQLDELCERLNADAERLDATGKRETQKDIAEVKKDRKRLVEKLQDLTRRVSAPRNETLRLAGAAGGAEDLL